MTQEYKESLAELNMILQLMDKEYYDKLPQKFIKFIHQNMDLEYKPNIDRKVPLNEQNLKEDTRILLSLIYRNYWCDKEKRTELIKEDLQSKKEYDTEMREKYNPDNVIKPSSNNEVIKEKTEIIEYQEPKWYQKLFSKILKLLKKTS